MSEPLALPPDVQAPEGRSRSTDRRSANGRVVSKVLARYQYRDEQGRVLYENRRYATAHGTKTFRPFRPDGQGWRSGLEDVRRVVYRLPDLVRCAEGGESPVAYLVEGEKDVDRLVAEGLCATTVFGGTGGTLPADFVECFRGFSQVIVLADNDAPGKKAARYRAELVAEVVGDVRLVEELPGVGHKGDASDFLDGGRTVEELCRVGDAGEQIRPASKMTENRSDVFLSATQAERLADFANERYRLGSDTKGEPFAIRRNGPNLALRMRGSGGFRQSLATQWRADTGKVLNQTALGDALAALEGEATNNDREEVFLRIARRPEGSGALLDLGTADGATVEIGPGGWSVLAASPVPFRRTALTGALPVPVRGGSLQDLRKVVNVEDEDWPLALAWLVSAFWPNVSHPVLLLSGEQGSAKSTSLRYLAGVLDASPAPLRPPSKDVESWVGMASGSLVVAIDNVSRIPGWFSDALCRAVTGEALVRRKLYTDDDHSIVTLRCLVGITAIDLGPIQGDLADRVVRIECPLIADESRWSDEDVNRHMEERGATIFGAFLDLASDVFEAHARVSLPGTPRMSDFARVLAAVDLVLGSAGYARYIEQRQALAASIIDGDPVARSLAAFIDGEGEWEGTTGNLLGSLTPPDPRPRTWPANPAALGQRLAKIAPGMRAAGYIIDHLDKADRRGNRGWHLAVRTEKPPEMAPVPPAREESVRTGHGPNRETSGNTARTARTARDAS